MFSWDNKKTKQFVSGIIAALLILAMVLPLLLSAVA